MRVFEPAKIGPVLLSNRILRSATFEGLCDPDGRPGPGYAALYTMLSAQGLGAIITGFAFVSRDGRAMQPGQAGIDADDKIDAFRPVTRAVHENGCRLFLQVAHAGRQTVPAITGGRIYAPSARKSPYFNHRPQPMTPAQIEDAVQRFADAARRAQAAGFDGVQLHAAHGYLIHQFLHPAMNERTDEYGVEPRTGIGAAFLGRVIDRIRTVCGAEYPVLIKVSAGDNYRRPFREQQFIHLIRFCDSKRLDAIEISFGTMDHALNIFRGESIPVRSLLRFNPRYRARSAIGRFIRRTFMLPVLRRQLTPFAPMYNLAAARLARQHTSIPIICVGGFRNGTHIRAAIEENAIDFVSLCRPLICEPDVVQKMRRDEHYQSQCVNCNRCAVMCDSGFPTRCYARRTTLPWEEEGPGANTSRAGVATTVNQASTYAT
jgi:2,4-dienoyl-CoA reductase-like NADH-dependent reductase (Old Yellow Enzyme family)